MQGMLKGIPVSEGIAIGKAWVLESPWDEVINYSLNPDQVKREVRRYKNTIADVMQQLVDCRDRVHTEIGEEEALIFEAHLAILNDPFFQTEIPAQIEELKSNAEFLLKKGVDKLLATFTSMDNEFFKARGDDIRDVGIRILRDLQQHEESTPPADESVVLVAHSLTPSETARIHKDKVLGFITELGGKTSHASILARSMGLPAVVGLERLLRKTRSGDTVIVDGNAGIVYINPTSEVLDGFRKRKKQFDAYWKRLSKDAELPSVSADGVPVSLQANIAISADIGMALRYKADAIGLFRTELPFLTAGRLLSEDEQYDIYKTIAESMEGKYVCIRTLDLGGDKFLPFEGVEEEHNPFLGWRSIRISLQELDVFKAQLRAILRASLHGNVGLLFPMISSLEEIIDIKAVLAECREELKAEGLKLKKPLPFGIMIEVPSAAIMAHQYIDHVDHFSIGTNDLIQYTLAVDRNNEKVARFYQPLNPAIVHLIYKTIHTAETAKKSVALCGEMAGNPLYTGMLLGLGLREFSMSPLMLPEVKNRIRAVTIAECEQLADKVLQLPSAEQIEAVIWDFHKECNRRQSVPDMNGNAENFIKENT
ncbi:phosphoenolpyruvate--protein phosphotransferase [bacterium]|nr:phosphoenolpyruvate--protein phosphotransferase [bacterium]